MAPAGAQPAAAGPGEVRATARAVLADPRFQRALPSHEDLSGLDVPGKGFRLRSGVPAPAVSLPALGAGAFLAKVIFIVLLAVVAVLIAVGIAQMIVERRRPALPEGGPAEAQAAAVPEREPDFADASRLAAEGRYAEAVHALLLAAIRHFAERSRIAVQPSRTSRELVRLLPLGPETREAFTELVRTVELSLFGGAAVGREDYERNLDRFRALTRRPA